jgi:hypothetical protein
VNAKLGFNVALGITVGSVQSRQLRRRRGGCKRLRYQSGIRTPSLWVDTGGSEHVQGDQLHRCGAPVAGQTNQGTESPSLSGTPRAMYNQGAYAIAYRAPTRVSTNQGNNSTAVGNAGGSLQSGSHLAVAMGNNSGLTSQGASATAVGQNAAQISQGLSATAVGQRAGETNQASAAVAVGYLAGQSNQGISATAVGNAAGNTSQGLNSAAVGREAGKTSQGTYSVAVGFQSAMTGQSNESVAMGTASARYNQGTYATAVGRLAGENGQGASTVAMGRESGRFNQEGDAIAIGHVAGETSQGTSAVAAGYQSGRYNQGTYTTAVGYSSAYQNQGNSAVAVGNQAGKLNQGADAVAIGDGAGQNNQAANAVAIGLATAQYYQRTNSVAIGNHAQRSNATSNPGTATAIGYKAGSYRQQLYCTAVGENAGLSDQQYYAQAFGFNSGVFIQRHAAVAIGQSSGYSNQGTKALAVGIGAGHTNQSEKSIVIHAGDGQLNGNIGANRFLVKPVRSDNSGSVMRWNSTTNEVCRETSDDRLKDDEKLIRNALNTIMKLKPQIYEKRGDLDPQSQTDRIESGHMAQDIYYDTPELRHLVHIPDTAKPTPEKPPAPSDDPRDDPDYSAWGKIPTDFDKEGLIPYLVRGVQELNRELPRSKTTVSNTWGQNISSLVVSADTNKHKTNTIPIVSLSTINNDKSWYGVVSDEVADTDDYDTLINVKGDTRIWVVDTNGSLESGDLLTTSNISPGYTQKQGDDFIRNYTVAKVTQDCDFTEPTQRPVLRRKQQLSDVRYYLKKQEAEISYADYAGIADEKRRTTSIEVKYRKPDEDGAIIVLRDTVNDIVVDPEEFYNLPESQRSKQTFHEISEEEYNALTAEEKDSYTRTEITIYKRILIFESKLQKTSHPIEEIRQELVDVLDENGQIVWEETGETEPVYTLVDHGTHKAALVTCKLI